MILKQGEWNIVQIGNIKYENLCKNVKLKTVLMRSGLRLLEISSEHQIGGQSLAIGRFPVPVTPSSRLWFGNT